MTGRTWPPRTLLFAPANRFDLLKKFPRFEADAYAIDLEDGTPEADKPRARDALVDVVRELRRCGLNGSLLVRVNASASAHAAPDLAAARDAGVDAVILPKLEQSGDVEAAAQRLGDAVPLVGLIETVRGVAAVETLAAAAGQRLCALAFGAEDFIADLGGRRTEGGLEVLYARSRVLLAAKAAGMIALDQVFLKVRDIEGLRRDAEQGRALGYTGKMCIAPGQVATVNAVFSPSVEEIERSRRLIDAYESASAEGRGVIQFEGVMVDGPLLKRAQAVIDLARRLSGEDG